MRKNERNKTDEKETARQLTIINEHESKEEQSGLESLIKSAQNFRQEPSVEPQEVLKSSDRGR